MGMEQGQARLGAGGAALPDTKGMKCLESRPLWGPRALRGHWSPTSVSGWRLDRKWPYALGLPLTSGPLGPAPWALFSLFHCPIPSRAMGGVGGLQGSLCPARPWGQGWEQGDRVGGNLHSVLGLHPLTSLCASRACAPRPHKLPF